MKVLLVVAIALGVVLGAAEPGRACSAPAALTPTEPRALVADADAAFIGTLVAVRPKEPLVAGSPWPPQIFTYTVEEQFKGDLGNQVEITSVLPGSGCGGLDGTIGRRVAFLLTRREDAWGPWGVQWMDAETLRRSVLPLPQPDGVGRPAFVAGGHFGVTRSVLLDSRGRTLTYGWGRGAATALSIRPGGKTMVELVRSRDSVRFALRELPSLRLLNEVEVRANGYGESIVCRSRYGADALASVYSFQQKQPEMQLLRITPLGTKTLERAPQLALAVREEQAFISLSDGRLLVRNLVTGTRRTALRTGQLLTGMSISPDRRFLAGFAGDRIVVADLAQRETKSERWAGFRGQTQWVGPRTFIAWSSGSPQPGRLDLLDQELRQLRPSWSWTAHTTAVSSAGIFGVDWSGALLTERNGYIVPLGKLFSPAVAVLAPLQQS